MFRIDSEVLLWDVWNMESLLHLCLDKEGSTLEALVRVFLIDSRVVLARIFTALEHKGDQREQLQVSIF